MFGGACMRSIFQRPFAESIISGYLEMGKKALEYGQFAIALRMLKAAFEEPGGSELKQYYLIPILLHMAKAHEGQKQLYKAKLLYIRVLAHHRKRIRSIDAFSVEILVSLARVAARQGLFRQSLEFVDQATECFCIINSKRDDGAVDSENWLNSGDQGNMRFARALWELERIFSSHGRVREQKNIHALIGRLQLENTESNSSISNYSAL